MFDEDLSVFFNTDDFADAVTIDGVAVNGILSRDFVESNYTETNAPLFVYEKAIKPDVIRNSVLVHSSGSYKVKGIQPDETQRILTLILEKQ